MRPGCKVDHLPILEGRQGGLKSTALNTLVGDDWFTDQIADLGTKDSCQDLRGKWVIELSELSAIRPREVEKVKAYITRRCDHYRPSYGRHSVDFPRQTVFVGTTNAKEYLSDSTGGRRFWPVQCTTIDIPALAADREQLWAEAVDAYHQGEAWWLTDEALPSSRSRTRTTPRRRALGRCHRRLARKPDQANRQRRLPRTLRIKKWPRPHHRNSNPRHRHAHRAPKYGRPKKRRARYAPPRLGEKPTIPEDARFGVRQPLRTVQPVMNPYGLWLRAAANLLARKENRMSQPVQPVTRTHMTTTFPVIATSRSQGL